MLSLALIPPGAHPSVRFPIKSVTCYMLNLKYDSAYSRKELLSFYKPFNTSHDVKLMFCVHPVHAADFKTPTKRVEAVDMCKSLDSAWHCGRWRIWSGPSPGADGGGKDP